MAMIKMSERELTRLRVLIDLSDDRLTVEAAGTLLGLGRRQVYRLRCAFAAEGPTALVSRKRGRAGNHRHGATFRQTVLSLIREHYGDFGPTLAVEKVAARHGLRLGVETLRQWMIAEGLWVDRRHRLPSPHQPRRRRECLGELVQIDGSEHAWFEDRGPTCTLLAFVDDATSRLMVLRFVASESTFDYFRATRTYLEIHGKPVAFYSDKHNIFRVNNGEGGERVTQFGRALEALNIDIICANSPQAKGRVERAFGTLQDRLVKEMRLAGIASIEAANAWLPGFMASYNARFGREPANIKDLHRRLIAADDLDEILAWREERTVTHNLTLHYDRMMLILEPTPRARGLVRKKVEVVNYPDGRFAVQCNGTSLPFRMFDKVQTVQPGTIVDNKRLSAVLAMVKARQAEYAPNRQRGHVARQRPPNNLEAPGMPSKGRGPRGALALAAR
ncbi:MAG: ISNCY family transposase [Acetobacteraceae bacterium]|nr:ISNCY family transposase [Acetobacteraceae bacterium]